MNIIIILGIIIILMFLYIVNSKYFKYNNISENLWKKHSIYNNCYAYAFNDINFNKISKPQPGFKDGLEPLKKNEYTCNNFIYRVLSDNPNSLFLGSDPKNNDYDCGKNNHLVFLALDIHSNFKDYHFYKKEKNNYWTHKPGELDVMDVDASGKKIINPYFADKHYKDFNYMNCGFFCTSD